MKYIRNTSGYILSIHPSRAIMMNNAHHSCITAAAGTCISHGFYYLIIIIYKVAQILQQYVFFISTNSLDRIFIHCPKFLTAVENR